MRILRALTAPLVLTALAVGGLAPLARAQSPADALRAEAKPIALKDVPDDYRAVTLGGGSEMFPWLFLGVFSGGGSDRGPDSLIFRAIGAVWVQPDEFAELLDGKRPRVRGYRLDLSALMSTKNPTTPVFTESWLEGGRIVSWSPSPDLTKPALTSAFAAASKRSEGTATETAEATAEAAASAAEAAATDASVAPVPVGADGRTVALKQIALATIMYAQDYDERFPDAQASARLQPLVLPYLKDARSFANSSSGGRVLYNTHLSGLALNAVKYPTEVPLLWEERAWPDGRRSVAFVDGHVMRLNAEEWARAQQAEQDRRVSGK